MNREEMVAKLAELKQSAKEKAIAYNEAMGDERVSEATKLEAEIDTVIHEYTATAKQICFGDCKNSGSPMMAAVKRLTFDTIRAVYKAPEGDFIEKCSIEEVEKAIDLEKLHKYCNGIGKDQKWLYYAQKLNFLLTVQKAKDLGIDPKSINDSYAVAEIARDLDMGKTPTSKTNMLKTLNMVIAAMVGEEFKATSHDVNYLLTIWAKKSNKRALTVTAARHRSMYSFLAEICHRIVLNKAYDIEVKERKA